MRIRFLEDREVVDHNNVVVQSFRAGEVVDLSTASARRWLKREVAEEVGEDVAVGVKEAPEAPDVNPPEAGSGASLDSGPEQPSSASQAAPASQAEMSSGSDEPTPQDGADASQSTDGSDPKEDASSTPTSPTSSTPRTRRGGARRKTRRASKG